MSCGAWGRAAPGLPPLVRWPGPDSTVPLTRAGGDDQPDLLRTCGAGYAAPAGLPVLVLFPTATRVSQAAITVDGEVTETCVVDEHTLSGSDLPGAAVGRTLLAGDHATVVIPRRPAADRCPRWGCPWRRLQAR